MKKLFLSLIILCGITGVAMADLGYSFAAKYSSTAIWSNENKDLDRFLPFGLGIQGGLGFGFGENNKYSVGVEAVYDFTMNDYGTDSFIPVVDISTNFQVRTYFAYNPVSKLYLVPFVGIGLNFTSLKTTAKANSLNNYDTNIGFNTSPLFGMRVEFSFFFIEALYQKSASIKAERVDFGIGFIYRGFGTSNFDNNDF